MKATWLKILMALMICAAVFDVAADAKSSYEEAAAELEAAFDEAGDDTFLQREALQDYAAAMFEIADRYQGDIADQALIESAAAFDLSGNAGSAEKALRAAERRIKTWELQLLLLKTYIETKNQETAAKKYAETLVPAAKQSKVKKNQLVPMLQLLGMKREIAELEGSSRDESPSSGKEKPTDKPGSALQEAPDFLARDFETGFSFSLKDYRGKVVLIDFWATWCGPCIQEMPHVIRAYQKYHDKGFEIIGISLDTDKSKLRDFLRANEIEWRQAYDGKSWKGEIVQQYGVSGIPATFLVDEEGNLIGANLRGSALERKLSEIYGR